MQQWPSDYSVNWPKYLSDGRQPLSSPYCWAPLCSKLFSHPYCNKTMNQAARREACVLTELCPNYHKDSSQEPICLGSQLSNQRFISPALQRVNRSGNICEASRFDAINRRASSVKQHSHDALISFWSAFLWHCLYLSLSE